MLYIFMTKGWEDYLHWQQSDNIFLSFSFSISKYTTNLFSLAEMLYASVVLPTWRGPVSIRDGKKDKYSTISLVSSMAIIPQNVQILMKY